MVRENGFTIHDVPGDGNYLFNAIAYQLRLFEVCSNGISELRSMVANNLEENKVYYCDFLAQPIAFNDSYNADTETPNDHDAYVGTIVDPGQQVELRWANYINRLRNGAWGDHIAIQGMSNVFNIAVNVISSENPGIICIVPMNSLSQHEVFVGLILQYHYVGLDKISCTHSNGEKIDNVHDLLNDETIAEGDEHIRQITSGPQASMMSLEAFGQVYSIAPVEGQKPLSLTTDSNFEAMVNPDKFCFGTGTLNTERPRKLTYRKYFNQRLLDVDGRFAHDLDYLFIAQYIVEAGDKNQVHS